MLKFIDRIYISFCVLSFCLIGILLGKDVWKQFKLRFSFDRAHSALEMHYPEAIKHSKKLSLKENRELIALESEFEKKKPPFDPSKPFKIVIDKAELSPELDLANRACFDSEGNWVEQGPWLKYRKDLNSLSREELEQAALQKISLKEAGLCFRIKDFSDPGKPWQEFLWSILYMLAFLMGVFLLRRWAIWIGSPLFNKPQE